MASISVISFSIYLGGLIGLSICMAMMISLVFARKATNRFDSSKWKISSGSFQGGSRIVGSGKKVSRRLVLDGMDCEQPYGWTLPNDGDPVYAKTASRTDIADFAPIVLELGDRPQNIRQLSEADIPVEASPVVWRIFAIASALVNASIVCILLMTGQFPSFSAMFDPHRSGAFAPIRISSPLEFGSASESGDWIRLDFAAAAIALDSREWSKNVRYGTSTLVETSLIAQFPDSAAIAAASAGFEQAVDSASPISPATSLKDSQARIDSMWLKFLRTACPPERTLLIEGRSDNAYPDIHTPPSRDSLSPALLQQWLSNRKRNIQVSGILARNPDGAWLLRRDIDRSWNVFMALASLVLTVPVLLLFAILYRPSRAIENAVLP